VSAPAVACEYRLALERLLLEQARWHDAESVTAGQARAGRHERSAEALREAAAVLRGWPDDEIDLEYFCRLAQVLERRGLDPDPALVLRGAAGAARRFCYDAALPAVGEGEVTRLVEGIFTATVEGFDRSGFARACS